jgi:hypothetical protein
MNQETEYLWELFCLYFADASDIRIIQHINSKCSELSESGGIDLEYIGNFTLTHDRISLEKAIVECVRRRCFDVARHVQLVAALAQRECINLDVAADMLAVRGSGKERLSKEIEQVIDVAWLINEDRRDNIMAVDADSLLKDALEKVAADFLSGLVRAQKP